MDFAGGTVVHISSGVSALVCALVLGKRRGYGHDAMPPHNLTYTVIGATLLWVGWFGFNAGSALNASGLAASAFCTHALRGGRWRADLARRGMAGQGQTHDVGRLLRRRGGTGVHHAGRGIRRTDGGLLMGGVCGVVCFWTATEMKHKLGYDDSLDAFGVHGVGGTLGAILTGIFATRAVTDVAVSQGQPMGLLEGGKLLMPQIAATAMTWVYAGVLTFLLLKVLDAVMGLRVSEEDEVQGLDYTQHGEEGYIFL